MEWIYLTDAQELNEIKEKSKEQYVVIFKHSTRCSTSILAKSRLERSVAPAKTQFYFLDILKYRPISNQVEREFGVIHESPQILVIKDGVCIYDESHIGIDMNDIAGLVSAA